MGLQEPKNGRQFYLAIILKLLIVEILHCVQLTVCFTIRFMLNTSINTAEELIDLMSDLSMNTCVVATETQTMWC